MRGVLAGALLLAVGLPAWSPALATGDMRAEVKTGAEAWSRGDWAGAVRAWQGPAEQGDADAQFNLGQAYKLGRGVPLDLARAEALFGKAAAQGHIPAADNYGLLLFDRGARTEAMPYVRAAAGRGDPRAQYLLGIAHFNGDLADKDWVRAYALMTLANGAGLPQAVAAMAQMDQFIPLAQRQEAAGLAARLGTQAEAARRSQLAASDLASPAARPAPRPLAPARPASQPLPRPDAAVAVAARQAGGESPATAGADYARPASGTKPAATLPAKPMATKPAQFAAAPKPAPAATKPAVPAARPVVAAPAPKPSPAPSHLAPGGRWRVQFGAFSVPGNADALWARVRGRPEVAGHPRLNVAAGKASKLQAGGYASREAASAACAGLARSGIDCLPVSE